MSLQKITVATLMLTATLFAQQKNSTPNAVHVSSGEGVQYAQNKPHDYVYSQKKNIEYLQVENIEKLKKAVVILIDKYNAIEAWKSDVDLKIIKFSEQSLSEEQKQIVMQMKTSIDKDFSLLRKEISALKKQNVVSLSAESKELTDDEKKILNFIENEK